uniref:Uncharacterized protein n=1 Tax=Solanum lycopersicum TaxID=4081 RepID=A0A3Q7FV29_SOLLC
MEVFTNSSNSILPTYHDIIRANNCSSGVVVSTAQMLLEQHYIPDSIRRLANKSVDNLSIYSLHSSLLFRRMSNVDSLSRLLGSRVVLPKVLSIRNLGSDCVEESLDSSSQGILAQMARVPDEFEFLALLDGFPCHNQKRREQYP